MSHVKRDGKCYDLSQPFIRSGGGFEVIGYSLIISCTVVVSIVLGLVTMNATVAGIVLLIGSMILGYQVYNDRKSYDVDYMISKYGKEVTCPPSDYDFKKQYDDFSNCVTSESMSKCPGYMTECVQPFEKCEVVTDCYDTFEQCAKKYPGCPPPTSDTCNSILKYNKYDEIKSH